MTSGSHTTRTSATAEQHLSKVRGSPKSIKALKARLRQVPCTATTCTTTSSTISTPTSPVCSSYPSSPFEPSPATLSLLDEQSSLLTESTNVDRGSVDTVLTFLDLDALQDFSPPTSSPASPNSSLSNREFQVTPAPSSPQLSSPIHDFSSDPSEPSSPDFAPLSPISEVPSSPSESLQQCAPAGPSPCGLFDSFAPQAMKYLLPAEAASQDPETVYLNGVQHLVESYGEGISTSLDKSGYSLIHYACAAGYLNVVKFFQKSSMSACLHLLDYYGNNPLLTAVQYNRLFVIPFLVENGVDARHRNGLGHNALRLACDNGYGAALTTILDLLPGIDVNERDLSSRTLLQYACAGGNREIVEILIRHGANPLLKDLTGANSLTTAVMHDHHSFLELLIEDRNILEATDRLGRTPLHWASAVGNLAAVKLLIKNGAKIEQRDKKGRTPFLLASFSHQTSVLQFLRQKKANKDVEDYEGRVPNYSALF